MTNSNEKCWKCGKAHGTNDGSGYQPCRNTERRPTPPIVPVPRPQLEFEATATSSLLTDEQKNQIRELTLKKVFLSVLLISIPILLWKLDSIIMAFKA